LAFNTVRREHVRRVLGEYDWLREWIDDWLAPRRFEIEADRHVLEKVTMTGETPQGSPLSPALFTIYMSGVVWEAERRLTQRGGGGQGVSEGPYHSPTASTAYESGGKRRWARRWREQRDVPGLGGTDSRTGGERREASGRYNARPATPSEVQGTEDEGCVGDSEEVEQITRARQEEDNGAKVASDPHIWVRALPNT